MTDRKELLRAYKETPPAAGVYRVRDTVTGGYLLGSSRNLPGILNRHRFSLELGRERCRDLQRAWDEASASVAADESAVRLLLDAQKAKYRLLDGVTVTMGPTPDGKQAVSYYREGEIIVSPQHVASLQKIMGHEIWHIIDWRDNGRIDWGEAVPPLNAATYLK